MPEQRSDNLSEPGRNAASVPPLFTGPAGSRREVLPNGSAHTM